MNKKLGLIVVLFIAMSWQPTHNHLMSSGMFMSSEVHSLATMFPFLAILLIMIKPSFKS